MSHLLVECCVAAILSDNVMRRYVGATAGIPAGDAERQLARTARAQVETGLPIRLIEAPAEASGCYSPNWRVRVNGLPVTPATRQHRNLRRPPSDDLP